MITMKQWDRIEDDNVTERCFKKRKFRRKKSKNKPRFYEEDK